MYVNSKLVVAIQIWAIYYMGKGREMPCSFTFTEFREESMELIYIEFK